MGKTVKILLLCALTALLLAGCGAPALPAAAPAEEGNPPEEIVENVLLDEDNEEIPEALPAEEKPETWSLPESA